MPPINHYSNPVLHSNCWQKTISSCIFALYIWRHPLPEHLGGLFRTHLWPCHGNLTQCFMGPIRTALVNPESCVTTNSHGPGHPIWHRKRINSGNWSEPTRIPWQHWQHDPPHGKLTTSRDAKQLDFLLSIQQPNQQSTWRSQSL